MIFVVFTCLISYLIASINPAILISKKVLNKDIRELGSKNAGTTNSIRTMGKKVGAIVFILDIFKVVVSYIIINIVGLLFKQEFSYTLKTLYILFSVLGHSYPIYYGFKGGKGVAVFLMSATIVDPKISAICILVGVTIIAIFRMVSLGSILGSILMVILSLVVNTNYNFWLILITVCIIIFNHRTNIVRILAGKENKLF